MNGVGNNPQISQIRQIGKIQKKNLCKSVQSVDKQPANTYWIKFDET